MPETIIVAEPGKPTIVITRIFDAPRALVWQAMTRPEILRRWWGPCTSELIVCENDQRVGGKWRNVVRFADGSEHAFSGEYLEVLPEQRVHRTYVYERYPQAVATETAVLVEHVRITKLTVTVTHAAVEYRDAHVAAGMQHGVHEVHARLDEVLASMRRAA
jgi:uncharacterized protein YndB with AHSA1/START domain